MAVSLNNADNYLINHKLNDVWFKILGDGERQSLMDQAENYINNTFTLRVGAEDTLSYEHAIYEQMIHLVAYDKERYLTQTQGVGLFSYDGIQVQQSQSLISPISLMFLKKLICRKVGDIR
jgi:hypothetical protein